MSRTAHEFEDFDGIHAEVTFVSPSGVMAIPGDGGPIVCRRQFQGAFINLDAEDGIRVEMASKRKPVPWYSQAERRAALELIRDNNWLEPADKSAIARHIAGTPAYEWEES